MQKLVKKKKKQNLMFIKKKSKMNKPLIFQLQWRRRNKRQMSLKCTINSNGLHRCIQDFGGREEEEEEEIEVREKESERKKKREKEYEREGKLF